MRVYFMRHGSTQYNRTERVQGRIDNPLNEDGIREAKLSAKHFKEKKTTFDRVYASTLTRAKTTAAIVSGYKEEEILLDERIQELDFGVLDGICTQNPPAEVVCLRNRPQDYIPPKGGETLGSLDRRCRAFIRDLEAVQKEEPQVKNVLVVLHGWSLKAVMNYMKQLPVTEKCPYVGNCGYICGEFDGENWLLEPTIFEPTEYSESRD